MSFKYKLLSHIMLVCFGIQAAYAQSDSWYNQDIWKNEDRAFLWYPDNKPKAKPKLVQTVLTEPTKPKELQEFERLQKQLDESRKIAVMNPSEANLKRYIALQEKVMQHASAFTDQWQRVIWQNPQLDYSQHGRPTNNVAMQQYDHHRHLEKGQAIKKLAGTNGIMFFFRSDCPYCHAMAPIMRQFAEQYGVKVMPVSLDGRGISHFPNPLPNNGIAERLSIQHVPAVYIMDTKTRQFKPIGFGVMSQSTLEDRFLAISKPVGTVY